MLDRPRLAACLVALVMLMVGGAAALVLPAPGAAQPSATAAPAEVPWGLIASRFGMER